MDITAPPKGAVTGSIPCRGAPLRTGLNMLTIQNSINLVQLNTSPLIQSLIIIFQVNYFTEQIGDIANY